MSVSSATTISNLVANTSPLVGTEVIPSDQNGVTIKITIDDIISAVSIALSDIVTTAKNQAAASASSAAASAAVSGRPYPNIFATQLPKGITSINIGGTPITGATPGNYPLVFTGGSVVGVTANLVVDTPTAARIVFAADPNGRPTYGLNVGGGITLPTIANPADAHLPVGTTLTPVLNTLIAAETQTYWVQSSDNTQLLLYGNHSGVATPAGAGVGGTFFGGTQLSIYTKSGIDNVVANFNAIYSFGDQSVSGTAILKLSDTNDRLIIELDQDATVGLTSHVPINVPDGTIPFSALDAEAKTILPFSLFPDDCGDALQILTEDGLRKVLWIPNEYPVAPIGAYVTRAAVADTALGAVPAAVNDDYVIEQYDDDNGIGQLRSRRRADGFKTILTSGMTPSTGPFITSDNQVGYLHDDVVYSIPADGGVAAPIYATPTIWLVGDSMTASGSGYGEIFSPLVPDRPVFVTGEPGVNTAGIAVAAGVKNRMTFSLAGNAIPTSGNVIGNPSVLFFPAPYSNRSCLVNITTLSGVEVTCNCFFNGTNYAISPLVYPSSPLPIAANAPARVISLLTPGPSAAGAQMLVSLYNGTVVIRTGRNDIDFNRNYNRTQILADIAAIVALMRPLARQLIIMGVTTGYINVPSSHGAPFTGTMTDAQAVTTLTNAADLNAALAAAYPYNFIDPLANHIALGGGVSVTILGNVYTVMNTTVCIDGTHETLVGKTNTANLVYSTFGSKGYLV